MSRKITPNLIVIYKKERYYVKKKVKGKNWILVNCGTGEELTVNQTYFYPAVTKIDGIETYCLITDKQKGEIPTPKKEPRDTKISDF